MTGVQYCVIEMDDLFYYLCFIMYVYVCIYSPSAEATHCDPSCIWPPEAILAKTEIMIKDRGAGWENVD